MESLHIQNFIAIFGYGVISFLLAIVTFPFFIGFVRRFKLTQKIRQDGMSGGAAKLFAKLHAAKAGTPTMGGIVIIVAVLGTVFLSRILAYFGWVDFSLLNRGETYLPIFTLFCVGILGVIDDYLNITESSAQKGLSAKVKFWSLFLFAFLGAVWFVFRIGYSSIHIPAVGDLEIGLRYFPLFIFIVVGVSNSLNFTDRLDG